MHANEHAANDDCRTDYACINVREMPEKKIEKSKGDEKSTPKMIKRTETSKWKIKLIYRESNEKTELVYYMFSFVVTSLCLIFFSGGGGGLFFDRRYSDTHSHARSD